MDTTTSEDLPVRGRLFIPAVGDRFRLAAPWRFRLFFEGRNVKFAQAMGVLKPGEDTWEGKDGNRWRGPFRRARVELPAGTLLECDRVYVRTFNKSRVHEFEDYDSITWKVLKEKEKGKGRGELKPAGRFWVKLPDCYSIEYELQWDSLYRDRVKVVDQVHDL